MFIFFSVIILAVVSTIFENNDIFLYGCGFLLAFKMWKHIDISPKTSTPQCFPSTSSDDDVVYDERLKDEQDQRDEQFRNEMAQYEADKISGEQSRQEHRREENRQAEQENLIRQANYDDEQLIRDEQN